MNAQLRDPLLFIVGSCVFNEPTIQNLLLEHLPLAIPFDFWLGTPESSIKRPNSTILLNAHEGKSCGTSHISHQSGGHDSQHCLKYQLRNNRLRK